MIKKIFTMNFLAGLLFCVIAVSAGLTFYFFFFEKDGPFEERVLKDLNKAPVFADYAVKQRQKDYSRFLDNLAGRKVFISPYSKGPKMPVKSGRKKIEKIVENLRLAGIKSGKDSRAMIEDKKIGRVFYLRENDSFSEDIKIEKIKKDSVILNCQGENYELYL